MKTLNEYLSLKRSNLYEGEQRKRLYMPNYLLVKCIIKDHLKKLSFEKLVSGTVIHAYEPGNFYDYCYCEFEKKGKNEWKFTAYTKGLNLRDSEWIEVNDEKKYTNTELIQYLQKSKGYFPTCSVYIPKKLKDGDFVGVEKYYDRWEEDDYIVNNREFTLRSFEKVLANIEHYDEWEYVSILHRKGDDEITFRKLLKKDLYVIFEMTEDELKKVFKKSNLDISKIKESQHIYLERS